MKAVVGVVDAGCDQLEYTRRLAEVFSVFFPGVTITKELERQIKGRVGEEIGLPVRFCPRSNIPGAAQFAVVKEQSGVGRVERLIFELSRRWRQKEQGAGWNFALRKWINTEQVDDDEYMGFVVGMVEMEEKRDEHYQFVRRVLAGEMARVIRDRRLWGLMVEHFHRVAQEWKLELGERPKKRLHDPQRVVAMVQKEGLFKWHTWEEFSTWPDMRVLIQNRVVGEGVARELWRLCQETSLKAVEYAISFGMPQWKSTRSDFLQQYLFSSLAAAPRPTLVGCNGMEAFHLILGQGLTHKWNIVEVDHVLVYYCPKRTPTIAYGCLGLVSREEDPEQAFFTDFLKNYIYSSPDGAAGVNEVVVFGDEEEDLASKVLSNF